MAATLSAEEEQVGLDSLFLCLHVFLSVLHRGKSVPIAALPGGISGPVHCVCATEASWRCQRCAMDLLRNGPESRAEMLYRFLALEATALVAPPPVPL